MTARGESPGASVGEILRRFAAQNDGWGAGRAGRKPPRWG